MRCHRRLPAATNAPTSSAVRCWTGDASSDRGQWWRIGLLDQIGDRLGDLFGRRSAALLLVVGHALLVLLDKLSVRLARVLLLAGSHLRANAAGRDHQH